MIDQSIIRRWYLPRKSLQIQEEPPGSAALHGAGGGKAMARRPKVEPQTVAPAQARLEYVAAPRKQYRVANEANTDAVNLLAPYLLSHGSFKQRGRSRFESAHVLQANEPTKREDDELNRLRSLARVQQEQVRL